MTLTDEQLLAVLNQIKLLDPSISSRYSDEQLITYINISLVIMDSYPDLPQDKLILAISLKTLSLLATPENSSLAIKRIKDVHISYYKGQGTNKWASLFDALISGQEMNDKSIFYIGV